MKRTSRAKRSVSAESIARLADKGADVSTYFTNQGKMMPPADDLGLELNKDMIAALNEAAKRLNVSRQTLIKRFIRSGLRQHSLDQKDRQAG